MATVRPVRATAEGASGHRSYRVRARHEDVHHGRLFIEPSFQAAAIAYVEHLPFSDGDGSGISVIVEDVETGHEHSFWVHVEDGEVAADP